MDFTYAISTTSKHKGKIAKKDVTSKRAKFYANYYRQNFSFPDSIIYYLAMFPSTPIIYQSIIQTCKYFFHKNPIILHSDPLWNGEKWRGYANGKWEDEIDLEKFNSRLWVTGRLWIFPKYLGKNIISCIIPFFYRCNARELKIRDQIISYSDYVYISSAAEIIHFHNITVKDKNGSIMALEKMFEIAVKVTTFTFTSDTTLSNITPKTVKKLFENPNFAKLNFMKLDHIPEAFDIEAFCDYIKDNKFTRFELFFDATISAVYKNRLNTIIDHFVANTKLNYRPPLIHYPGINYVKYVKLTSLSYFPCLAYFSS